MTNAYTTNIDGIGPVLFEKTRRAKRVIISVGTSKGTRVAVPTRTSFKRALEFVYLRKGWIQRALVKFKYYKSSGIVVSLTSRSGGGLLSDSHNHAYRTNVYSGCDWNPRITTRILAHQHIDLLFAVFPMSLDLQLI
jgi:predicted metal-dependent hydrolase